jgi:hypothetical protein
VPSRFKTLLCLLLLLSTALAFAQTTRPSFTISAQTTLLTGPLNPDGTINYVQAINDRLSQGITLDNNAAIPILRAVLTLTSLPSIMKKSAAVLGVTPSPDPSTTLQVFSRFVASRRGSSLSDEQSAAIDRDEQRSLKSLWKSQDLPDVADWLAQSKPALVLLESACEKPRCFLPWASDATPVTCLDAMPPMFLFRACASALTARAMLSAGQGDLNAALADLHRVHTLASFAAESRIDVARLVAVAIDSLALHGYGVIAASGQLSPEQIQRLRNDLDTLPPLALPADDFEEFFVLDEVMQCIRGQSDRIVCLHAGVFDNATPVQLGDFPSMDWDIFLSSIRREIAEIRRLRALPTAQRVAAFQAAAKTAADNNLPGGIFAESGQPQGLTPIEDFLKRRTGESRAAYAQRIAHWFVADNPGIERRMALLLERPALERTLAHLALSLADYHRTHNAYPDSLTGLGQPIPSDPLSLHPLIYHTTTTGYILYSIGINQKDDHAQPDDISIQADH